MRFHLALALLLLAGLHLLSDELAPPSVAAADLPDHLGATIQVQGRIVGVDPGATVHRVTLEDTTGRLTLLLRGPPPPLGGNLTATGQAAPGDGAPIVWAKGQPTVEDVPRPGPISLATALEQAPALAGRPVAVAGTWDPADQRLTGPAGSLPVHLLTDPPEPGPVLLWGPLIYTPHEASYRLEATGWSPWTSSS